MNKFLTKKTSLGITVFIMAVFLGIFGVSPLIRAEEPNDVPRNPDPISAQKKREESQKKAVQSKEEQKARLEQAKLKACQGREKAINNIVSRISTRGEKHLEQINKISQRAQEYYQKSGLTVANYDGLVANVNSKKAAAEAAVTAVKSNTADFHCDGSDLRGRGELFKSNLKKDSTTLKEYKKSVKELIRAIKVAKSESTSAGESQ